MHHPWQKIKKKLLVETVCPKGLVLFYKVSIAMKIRPSEYATISYHDTDSYKKKCHHRRIFCGVENIYQVWSF